MSKFIDLTGQRFGRLVVSEFDKRKGHHSYWKCKCDCGKEISTTSDALRRGVSQSCGCLRHDMLVAKATTHGATETPLYGVWCAIKTRCFNPNSTFYYDYGGRGITMCDEWKNSFQAFMDWAMSNGYSEGLSIDRIDNNGNYCPENCRWTDKTTQANNRRSNNRLTYNGETHTVTEWARILDVPPKRLFNRYYLGWDAERILTT